MAEALIQLVDEHDNPLRGGTMDEAQLNGIWHRIARVALYDKDGNILLHRRTAHSFYFASCWDLSATGHVDEGEDYREAAVRESQEELGISLSNLVQIDYYKSIRTDGSRTYNRFNKTYKAVALHDMVIRPEPGEVAEIGMFTEEEIKQLVETEPGAVTDGLKAFSEHILK